MKHKFIISLFCLLFISVLNLSAQQSENGFELYEKGEYQKAIEVLQRDVTAREKDQKAWLYLGMSYARINNKKEALKAFGKADKYESNKASANEIPVKILSKPRAVYTENARRNLVSGVIKLAVEFGTDGTIKAIVPFRTLPDGLTESSVEAAKKIKYEPATENGKPISYITIISYTFTIY